MLPLLIVLICYTLLLSSNSFVLSPQTHASPIYLPCSFLSPTSLSCTDHESTAMSPALESLWRSVPKPLLSLNAARPPTTATLNSLTSLLTDHQVVKVKFTSVKDGATELNRVATNLLNAISLDAELLYTRVSDRTVLLALTGVVEEVRMGVPKGKGMEREAWEKKYRGGEKPEKKQDETRKKPWLRDDLDLDL